MDLDNTFDISRIKKQNEFIASTKENLCMAGGFRSGKTWSCLLKCLLLSQLVPENRGFIGRLDGKDLRLTTMRDFES